MDNEDARNAILRAKAELARAAEMADNKAACYALEKIRIVYDLPVERLGLFGMIKQRVQIGIWSPLNLMG